ncbi:MAG: hypothetical protein AMS26_23430 [Bacteroides sp. SM23_62]|nr:MAG: hypothetical protein AMS26_23430 [Bacteroides sp. SM23_62]
MEKGSPSLPCAERHSQPSSEGIILFEGIEYVSARQGIREKTSRIKMIWTYHGQGSGAGYRHYDG